MPCMGEGSRDHGGCALGVPQGALDEAGIDAGCQERGGVGMSEGLEGDTGFGEPGALCGCAAGSLAPGATQRGGGGRTVAWVAPRGGKEPGRVSRGCPGGAEPREGLCGQGDVAVFGPRATGAMDLEALAIQVGDVQGQGCMEPKASTRDGGAGALVMQGGGGREELPALLHTEDRWETVGGLRAHACEGVPVASEDVRREEAETTGAEAPGGGGKAVDVFPVQEGVPQLLCGEAVGGLVVELGQQVDFSDRGFLRPFAFAAEVERRDHVLTQGAHEISPFVRRVVAWRGKTS
jgi:hypothetical protein